MQSRPIHAQLASLLGTFVARAGSFSAAALLLASTACSNAPSSSRSQDATESVHTSATRIVGYLPFYRGALSTWAGTLEFSGLTHVNLAFATFDERPDGLEIHYREKGAPSGDDPGLATFVKKAHENGVKVCLSVGGWDNREQLAAAILNAPNELAEKLALYAGAHDLDCIDADLEKEHPSAELIVAHEIFIRDLASRLHEARKQLTSAVAKSVQETTLPVVDEFDFLNVMAYDYRGAEQSTVPVQTSSMADAQGELDFWVEHGVAKNKLVWGMPFYGFQWDAPTGNDLPKGHAVPYRAIVEAVGSVPTNDEVTVKGATITLNSSETIRQKAILGKTSYGGAMMWELWQDAQDDHSLLKVVKGAQ